MIKAIVCDMDGTILNDQKNISDQDKETLIKLQENGYQLILCSGRDKPSMVHYALDLKMDQYHGYCVEINGTSIIDCQNEKSQVLGEITKEDVAYFLELLKDIDFELRCSNYEDDFIYISPNLLERKKEYFKFHHIDEKYLWSSQEFLNHLVKTDVNYPHLLFHNVNELPDYLNKIAMTHFFENIDEIYSRCMTPTVLEKYNVFRTNPNFLEVTQVNVSKGNGLKVLLDQLNIKQNEIIVFGDGENDVSMFFNEAHSVAMGNAAQYVKDHAKDVTITNNESGVSHYLKENYPELLEENL